MGAVELAGKVLGNAGAVLDLAALEAQFGKEALTALRDQLLRELPPEPDHATVRVLTRQEQFAAGAMERSRRLYGDGHLDRLRAIAEAQEIREARMRKWGRFYVEPYKHLARRKHTWHVMDRLTGEVAYFALDNPSEPQAQQGFCTRPEALECIERLDAYYKSVGVYVRPSFLIEDKIWLKVRPLTRRRGVRRMGLRRDDHAILSTLVLLLRDKLAWRLIPADTGCPEATCRDRIAEWIAAGVWDQIADMLSIMLPDGELLDWDRLLPIPADPYIPEAARLVLLHRIEAHLVVTGMAASAFGLAVLNTPAFVLRLRRGMKVRQGTHDTLREHLISRDQQEEPECHADQPSPARLGSLPARQVVDDR